MSTRISLMVLLAGSLFVGLLTLLATPTPLLFAQSTIPDLRYSGTSRSITIGRAYSSSLPAEAPYMLDPSNLNAPKASITLPQLWAWLQTKKDYSDTVRLIGPGIYQVDASLIISQNAQLDINSVDGVQEVRIVSRPEAIRRIEGRGGTINIKGVKVYSWDNTPGVDAVDTSFTYSDTEQITQTRAFIAALFGTRMNIENAEVMYLGYEEPNSRLDSGKGETSGLSWRLLPRGTNEASTGPKGSVINSKIHHNFFGLYTYQAVDMVITGNEISQNSGYGMDIHDASVNFTVANNDVHDNGLTGITFSRFCSNNKIYGNQSYNNGAHGLMLDRGSNNNEVYDNQFYGNHDDGVAIFQSKNNTIRNNSLTNNQRNGVRINAKYDTGDSFDDVASDNVIRNNTISGNALHGIYLYDRADRNTILQNQINNNSGNGLFVNAGLTLIEGNTVQNNLVEGVEINNKAYTTGTGVVPITAALSEPGVDNQIIGNQLVGNLSYGVMFNGGQRNVLGSMTAGNVISGNQNSGVALFKTIAVTIENNQILGNIAANGAGITITCNLGQTGYQIFSNIIRNNLATALDAKGAGILIGRSCPPVINNNEIAANRHLSSTLYPDSYNVQNNNSFTAVDINAENNFWGTTDGASIETTILHKTDDSTRGMVRFSPFRTESIVATPTPLPTATNTELPTQVPSETPLPTGTPTDMPNDLPTATTQPSDTPLPTNTPEAGATATSTTTAPSLPENTATQTPAAPIKTATPTTNPQVNATNTPVATNTPTPTRVVVDTPNNFPNRVYLPLAVK